MARIALPAALLVLGVLLAPEVGSLQAGFVRNFICSSRDIWKTRELVCSIRKRSAPPGGIGPRGNYPHPLPGRKQKRSFQEFLRERGAFLNCEDPNYLCGAWFDFNASRPHSLQELDTYPSRLPLLGWVADQLTLEKRRFGAPPARLSASFLFRGVPAAAVAEEDPPDYLNDPEDELGLGDWMRKRIPPSPSPRSPEKRNRGESGAETLAAVRANCCVNGCFVHDFYGLC